MQNQNRKFKQFLENIRASSKESRYKGNAAKTLLALRMKSGKKKVYTERTVSPSKKVKLEEKQSSEESIKVEPLPIIN